MRIAVLCDGAGLARLGLEQAGYECVGFELNPVAHYLSRFVGSGNCILANVRSVDLSGFGGAWASAPCQWRSIARTQGDPLGQYCDGTLHDWCLDTLGQAPNLEVWWAENVAHPNPEQNSWGTIWNAAQFTEVPLQNRNRVVGGNYPLPRVFRPYGRAVAGACPCITATEYKGSRTDQRRASRFFGRRLTLEECAGFQGFEIPAQWYIVPPGWTKSGWYRELYRAIGNGVPVYMARAFGEAAKRQGSIRALFA